MKKFTIAALTALSLGGMTYTAMADNHHGHGPAWMIEEVDANQDGSITKDEMAAYRTERFLNADTNGDSLVSAEEFEPFTDAERGAKRFAKMDANGDGLISVEENAAAKSKRMDRMFGRMDKDDDGAISEAELEAAKEKMRERGEKRGRGRRG